MEGGLGEGVVESMAGGSKNRWGTVGVTDKHMGLVWTRLLELILFQEQEEVPVPLPAEEEGVRLPDGQRVRGRVSQSQRLPDRGQLLHGGRRPGPYYDSYC